MADPQPSPEPSTDQLRAEGLEMPDLPDAYAAKLREMLPGEAAVANPIDLLADAREDRFGPAFEAAIAQGAGVFDAILMIHVVPFMVDAGPIIDTLSGLAASAPLPCFHSMMGTLEHQDEWFTKMEAAGVPAFNDSESMAETAGILAQFGLALVLNIMFVVTWFNFNFAPLSFSA